MTDNARRKARRGVVEVEDAGVIGVDPGSAITGYGVVHSDGGKFFFIDAGTIRANTHCEYGQRLLDIYDRLCALIVAHRPEALSLERQFVAVNVQSAFRLGEVRAAALMAAARLGVKLFEYAPAEVKLAVAAHGRADKAQVKFMVRRALGLGDDLALADDAADALGLALCHLSRARFVCLAAPRKARRIQGILG